jgi:hypothetical protein
MGCEEKRYFIIPSNTCTSKRYYENALWQLQQQQLKRQICRLISVIVMTISVMCIYD